MTGTLIAVVVCVLIVIWVLAVIRHDELNEHQREMFFLYTVIVIVVYTGIAVASWAHEPFEYLIQWYCSFCIIVMSIWAIYK